MKYTYSNLQYEVPIRARVAFVLAIADRVMPLLANNAQALNVAHKALNKAWEWEEGKDLRALEIYEDNVEEIVLQGSLIKDNESSLAINAITSAFYYMMWHAFKNDLELGKVRDGDIYNDMEEVSEDVIDQVCDFAAQTSFCCANWIDVIYQRLIFDFHSNNTDKLGPVVSRQYFKL